MKKRHQIFKSIKNLTGKKYFLTKIAKCFASLHVFWSAFDNERRYFGHAVQRLSKYFDRSLWPALSLLLWSLAKSQIAANSDTHICRFKIKLYVHVKITKRRYGIKLKTCIDMFMRGNNFTRENFPWDFFFRPATAKYARWKLISKSFTGTRMERANISKFFDKINRIL